MSTHINHIESDGMGYTWLDGVVSLFAISIYFLQKVLFCESEKCSLSVIKPHHLGLFYDVSLSVQSGRKFFAKRDSRVQPYQPQDHSLPEMADGNEETHPLEHGAFLDAWNSLVSHFNINLIMCEEMNAIK